MDRRKEERKGDGGRKEGREERDKKERKREGGRKEGQTEGRKGGKKEQSNNLTREDDRKVTKQLKTQCLFIQILK